MAARVCRSCQINWPVSAPERCAKCGGDTQPFAWRTPDPSTLKEGEEAPELTEYDRVLEWRAANFRAHGVDWDTSHDLAAAREPLGGFIVDLGRFRELVDKKGWPVEHAVAVLR